jgi:hypothetical protein
VSLLLPLPTHVGAGKLIAIALYDNMDDCELLARQIHFLLRLRMQSEWEFAVRAQQIKSNACGGHIDDV